MNTRTIQEVSQIREGAERRIAEFIGSELTALTKETGVLPTGIAIDLTSVKISERGIMRPHRVSVTGVTIELRV